MKNFRADLHIHSLLSPCGSLEMSPDKIIDSALKAGLDIIAITDHNSTRQAPLIKKRAAEKGLFVLMGAEITSKEEVHCLVLIDSDKQRLATQEFIDKHLIKVKNDTRFWGEQVVVDDQEMIVFEEPYLLTNAINVGIKDIAKFIHGIGGLFIPAHIDRPYNGLVSHLGFVPDDIDADAFGLTKRANIKDWIDKVPANSILLKSSDAHVPKDIGSVYSLLQMNDCSFHEIAMALRNEEGRKVIF